MVKYNKRKIFIGIACWRDPLVRKTVESAYSMADNPNDLSIGIIFQGYEEDHWMIDGIKDINKNITIQTFDAKDKQCPISLSYIRGDLTKAMLKDEGFYLQIDAHTVFAKSWDTGLKFEWRLAQAKFGQSILTSPIKGFRDWNEKFETVPALTAIPDKEIFKKWNKFITGKCLPKKPNTQMIETMMSACFRFSDREYVEKVQQPSNIIFDYETPVMTLKTFTAGYNMVSPSKTYAMSYDFNNIGNYPNIDVIDIRYKRHEDPNWKNIFFEALSKEKENFLDIINNPKLDSEFALYSKRSLKEYMDFSGFDIYTLEIFKEYTEEYMYQSDRINSVDI